MKKIFNVGEGFKVPDGTVVHSVLDPRIASQYKSEWVDEVSLALGVIPANTTSKIHVHPLITQVTWVLSGELTVKMKDDKVHEPYTLDLSQEQSVVTKPGVFFQLINSSNKECRVLYIVSPAFIFECNDKGEVIYNDALVLDHDWNKLSSMNWAMPQLVEINAVKRKRDESKKRLKANLGVV